MEEVKKILIWTDPNVFNEENQIFLDKIKKNFNYFIEIYIFNTLDEGIQKIKEIKFIQIKLMISGKFYPDFIDIYKNNLQNFNSILEVIIFTSNKENYLKIKQENKELMLNDKFYNIGGIVDNEADLMECLKPEKYERTKIISEPEGELFNEAENESNFGFESIELKELLIFPIFYKNLFNKSNHESNKDFLLYFINKYSYNNEVKELIKPLLKFSNIPVHILYKYFLRIYLLKSNAINKELKSENCYNFTSFLQVIYEALSLGLIKPFKSQNIYHASYIQKIHFDKYLSINKLITVIININYPIFKTVKYLFFLNFFQIFYQIYLSYF